MLSPTHVPDPPTSPTPHARSPKALSAEIAHPSSPELARPNSIYPPSQPVSQPNANDGHAMADPFGEEGLQDPHLPEPPTEVAALLMSHQTGDVVSPVFARNSPLAQWQLPPEIEYFWAGLFEITDVKVETSVKPRMQNTATVRRTWRFALQWVPGGEDLLRDDGQDGYKEWLEHIMRPWWEVEAVLRLDQLPSERSQDASMLTPNNEAIMTQGHFGRSRLLLPLPLLAPFTATSTASGNFPAGYYCMQCGRINVQRFLRHRDCGNASCTSRSDSHKPTSWVVSAFSTRDRKINTATFFPDDKWAAPVTASRTRQFEDGMSLHHYKLGTKLLANDPSSAVADSDVSDTDEKMPSVFHIFNGNAPRLQERPSELFETFQREIRFEREPGATCFSASHGPSKDATTCSVWDQQTEYIESALKQYCPNLSNLKVDGLLIRAWNSDGKTFRPTATCLVLLCLGADIALYSIASGTGAKSKAKATKEALRVTMVHGDVVVLKGPRFEFSMVRTGMCMLVEAQCI
ncbi:hypothetical protein BC834DRAFT_396278 [Gloeopeniophorella convolvens]|nr:hypothetical protein BC834DRAFT_396278 [Gloeopeniophorella convolvens]